MSKMQELYEKVSKSAALQEKFAAIVADANKAGEGAAMEERFAAFAKEEGYDITLEEMQAFFKGLVENKNEALSEAELDMVAGGKVNPLKYPITVVDVITGFSMSVTEEIMMAGCRDERFNN